MYHESIRVINNSSDLMSMNILHLDERNHVDERNDVEQS